MNKENGGACNNSSMASKPFGRIASRHTVTCRHLQRKHVQECMYEERNSAFGDVLV